MRFEGVVVATRYCRTSRFFSCIYVITPRICCTVYFPDMFSEGRPEFFHCFLWAAVFWWMKCLATQGALVRERLALNILADFKLRFFYCFLLPSGRAPCRAPFGVPRNRYLSDQSADLSWPGGDYSDHRTSSAHQIRGQIGEKEKNQPTWDEATTSCNQSKGGLCLNLRSRSGA